jgi:hypothetical protein
MWTILRVRVPVQCSAIRRQMSASTDGRGLMYWMALLHPPMTRSEPIRHRADRQTDRQTDKHAFAAREWKQHAHIQACDRSQAYTHECTHMHTYIHTHILNLFFRVEAELAMANENLGGKYPLIFNLWVSAMRSC